MTYRTVKAEDWIAGQPKDVRDDGETRGEILIREVTLKELRAAVKRTQVEVAAAMGTSQDRVSKLERGDDALVSTLGRHVRALGGKGLEHPRRRKPLPVRWALPSPSTALPVPPERRRRRRPDPPLNRRLPCR
jgi:transcriptional regulator with XRE-family HTH domain